MKDRVAQAQHFLLGLNNSFVEPTKEERVKEPTSNSL